MFLSWNFLNIISMVLLLIFLIVFQCFYHVNFVSISMFLLWNFFIISLISSRKFYISFVVALIKIWNYSPACIDS